MTRTQRVSDGKVPGYGKQVYDALAVDAAWRSRIAQEGTGYRTTDESGSSTSISMIWCPTAKLQDKGRTAKRPSEIKDLIGYDQRTPRPTPAAPAAARAIAAPVPPPSASQRSLCSSRASNQSGTSINTAQLDSEASRLQVCRRSPAAHSQRGAHERPPTARPPVTLPRPCFRTVSWASARARRRRRTRGRSGRRTCAWATWLRRGSISRVPSSCCRSRRRTCTMNPRRPHTSVRTSHARLRRARVQLLRLLGTRLAALAALGGSALVPVERRAPAHCPPPPPRLGLLSTRCHNSGLRSRRLQSARGHPGARRGEGDDPRQLCVSHAARPHPTT